MFEGGEGSFKVWLTWKINGLFTGGYPRVGNSPQSAAHIPPKKSPQSNENQRDLMDERFPHPALSPPFLRGEGSRTPSHELVIFPRSCGQG